MITVKLVEGRGRETERTVGLVPLPSVPRRDDLVEITTTGHVYVVRDIRWLIAAPGDYDSVVLEVQGRCADCHRMVWDGEMRCDRCKAEDEEPA